MDEITGTFGWKEEEQWICWEDISKEGTTRSNNNNLTSENLFQAEYRFFYFPHTQSLNLSETREINCLVVTDVTYTDYSDYTQTHYRLCYCQSLNTYIYIYDNFQVVILNPKPLKSSNNHLVF